MNPSPDKRPHVVNNSWGGGGGDTFYQQIVDSWIAAGIFPAFANGNSGPTCGSAGSPGDYASTYAVGAYDIMNQIAPFSSRGPSLFDGIVKPNIAGPGVDVRSSVPGNAYDVFSGTSMATPHISGVVALVWSAAPTLVGDIAATRALLDSTAVDNRRPQLRRDPGEQQRLRRGAGRRLRRHRPGAPRSHRHLDRHGHRPRRPDRQRHHHRRGPQQAAHHHRCERRVQRRAAGG
jgi:subtilisin family serine protease